MSLILLRAGAFLSLAASASAATDITIPNVNPITINDNTIAAPYPSQISVSGVNPALVTNVRVVLFGFTHTFPDDVDIILVGPQGQRAILMSDAGGSDDVSNLQFAFEQTATATTLPDSTVLTGGGTTYRPANYNDGVNFTDTFPGAAPGALNLAPADLSVFSATNPNGVWSLFVVDDAGTDVGTISQGWDLVLTVPQVFTVTKTADTNGVCNSGVDCSLREALAAAQNGDLINFSSLFDTPQTINLMNALPDINRSITIQGKGAHLLTVRRDFNAAMDFRIFTIPAGVTNGIAISGMTIADGRRFNNNSGGGINSLSTLTLTNVHVTGNHANASGGGVALFNASGVFTNCAFTNNLAVVSSGGAILFDGGGVHTLRIASSTVSGNNSDSFGGGIFHINNSAGNSRLEITNSTIVNNTAANTGGGIATATVSNTANLATTTLRNTIVAGNTIGATNTPNNLATQTFAGGGAATFQTLGFNLSNDYTGGGFTPLGTDITSATPQLAPLALYGGQTPTHALLGDSLAIDAGDSSGLATDQRGRVRPSDTLGINNISDGADIGAAEMQIVPVTTILNAGAGSLRQAIADAPPNSDILFAVPLFNSAQTITLGGTELVINKNLNIIGTGANLLTVSGGGNSRVFSVNLGITASLSGMTITGGNGVGATNSGSGGGILNNGSLTVTHSAVSGNTANGFGGGGIRNINAGTLTVTNSTISGNTANGGGTSGGIDSSGNLTVINSTISDNRAPNGNGNGGGIWTNGNVVITNSTIANNSAAGANSAGGVLRVSATVTIRNSIIAGNAGNATQPDVVANGGGGTGITSNGFNLIGNRGTVTFNQTGDQSGTGASPRNPGLAALLLNGGTTPTHALFTGSTALDAGQSSGFTSDQRGQTRPFDLPNTNISDGADIGAFEAQTAPPAAPSVFISDVSQSEGNSGTSNFNFTVSLSAASGSSVTVVYQTADGTATAPSDYTATALPTTLTFNAGETTKTISIPVNGDTAPEASENFFVNLLDAGGATISDNQSIGTIQDDDCPTITVNPSSLPNGAVGTAYNQTITASGGASPYNFAVTTGTLPAGLTLASGGVLSGTPTAVGTFNFTVTATAANNCESSRAYSVVVAQIFTVNNTNNDGAGSLRQAILDANANGAGADIINFSSLFNTPQTITLSTGELAINSNVTINGADANLLTVRRDFNAATDFRIFNITNGATNGVAISGMTIAGGRAPGNSGGGIRSLSNLTLTGVHVTGNQSSAGGGVFLGDGDGVFTGCTFSGNRASGADGGGINYQAPGRTLRLVNSTVSGNQASGGGGGIVSFGFLNANTRLEVVSSTIANNITAVGGGIHLVTLGGTSTATAMLRNSIIANNTPNNLATEAGGGAATFQTLGFNLSDNFNGVFTPIPGSDITSATPRLSPLALYGGQTPTHALLHSSPAIDQGNASGLTTDQRGVARVFDTGGVPNASDGADIGAVEMRPIVVLNTNDPGSATLRQAIASANSSPDLSDIVFDNAFFNTARTINLTVGEFVVTSDLNIIAPGANLLTVSGNNQSRVFSVGSGLTVNLNGMTITGGNGAGASFSGQGGGIYSEGNLTVSDSAISGNIAFNGGGIFSRFGTFNLIRSTVSNNAVGLSGGGLWLQDGNGTLINSTVSGNRANDTLSSGGGAAFVSNGGNFTLQVTHCTVANNTTGTANTGGGILAIGQSTASASATVALRNTIIANNSAPNLRTSALSGSTATFTSQGFNLTNDPTNVFLNQTTDKLNANAGLAALALNGGTTPTHALFANSAALDAGNSSGSTTDQRGSIRPFDLPGITNATGGDGADIGAFELDPLTITSIVRLPNGHILLQGRSEPGRAVTIQAAPDLNAASFNNLLPPATADGAGLWQYDDAGAIGQPKRFYRATLP